MKKKQLNRKLTLNKQTLSVLDVKAMHAIKGGYVTGQDKTDISNRSCACA